MVRKLSLALVIAVSWLAVPAAPTFSQNASEISENIAKIQAELEEIRGKKFEKPVPYALQSEADFAKYLDRHIAQQMPLALQKNYGKVVRALGLYNGPEITDFGALAKRVLQSQAAAYYDPETETFYVVMQTLNPKMMNALYAHELYHGLQDQYFDLDKYVLAPAGRALNDDETLARQAVVEGEATLIMTLWSMKSMFGQLPAENILDAAIRMQAGMDIAQMMAMIEQTAVLAEEDAKNAVASMKEIPRFILEIMVGSYLKGMAFVNEIRKGGWSKVEQLYTNPPVSSEQILHPQKWLDGERPVSYQWPALNGALSRRWQLLESNTLGEIQWRVIFAEQGLDSLATRCAAGWNGDSFGVFEDGSNASLALLVLTSWDNDKEAEEFMQGYERVLQKKYPGQWSASASMTRNGSEVIIVESDDAESRAQFEALAARIARQKN